MDASKEKNRKVFINTCIVSIFMTIKVILNFSNGIELEDKKCLFLLKVPSK